MAALLIAFAAFVIGAGLVAGIGALLKRLPDYLTRRRIEQRMIFDPGLDTPTAAEGQPTVVKRERGGPLPGIERLVGGTRGANALARLIEQSGSRISPSAVVLASIVIAIVLVFFTAVIVRYAWAPIAAGLIGLALPFVVLRKRRAKRMRRFEEQFPDALDLLSRALRAGHAFTTAMGMVASEALDPIGPEFRKTYDEQNFGLPLKEALNNLATRVPLLDVRFFVTAVLIQRDTGGNLSEILENLAYVVRERFKVLRQVRVYTAHGRFTGWVLTALPAGLALVLMVINPEHMSLLFTERMGQMMLSVAVVLQITGYLWIKKVVKIEV
ncbi:MAG: type II secretion system F family protein [Bacteroidales bacterium]